MIFYYINESDRSCDVEANTLQLTLALKRRSNKAKFGIVDGTRPTENQDVKIYSGGLIASSTANTITLKESYENEYNDFRADQEVFVRIGESDEKKVTVQSYNSSTRTITLTENHGLTLSEDDQVGELIFGGIIARVEDYNIHSIGNIFYNVQVVGFERIFDKKLIADTWEDVDARYIINDFVNSTVNYNYTLDNISYEDNTAIQAEWVESGDGDNPTVDTSDYLEGTSSGVFGWTNSSGTATFTASPDSTSVIDVVGVSSGSPTEGFLMLWVKPADYTVVSSIALRVGSDSSNYTEVSLPDVTSNEWQYLHANLSAGTTTGTPDWTAVDYITIVVTETGSSSIQVNGFRLNQDMSFTLRNVQETTNYEEYRAPQIRPSKIVNSLAEGLQYTWYIDFERDIHFKDKDVQDCFYTLEDDTDNFYDLKTEIDQSQLGNRIIIEGGERTSTSLYSQAVEGNGAVREWVLKSKFKNLSIFLDDNTSTDTMEAGTTTTNVTATGHGLSTGDYITNRTRNNEVRKITVVDPDNFTVEAIAGQTTGDTFSKFDQEQTVGIEGINDEALFDYMSNSNAQSVRASTQTDTLDTGDFLAFYYNERVELQLQYSDPVSVNALKALGLGDGVFDLDKIVDNNITDTNTALTLAEAKVQEFSNPIISGSFITNFKGFKAGDILQVDVSDRTAINGEYVIQKVRAKQKGGFYKDHMEYTIDFGTTLFGVIEFYQKLLDQSASLEINTDAIVSNFVTALEEVETTEVNALTPKNLASETEEIESSETNTVTAYGGDWAWEPQTGQPLNTRWSLFPWQ